MCLKDKLETAYKNNYDLTTVDYEYFASLVKSLLAEKNISNLPYIDQNDKQRLLAKRLIHMYQSRNFNDAEDLIDDLAHTFIEACAPSIQNEYEDLKVVFEEEKEASAREYEREMDIENYLFNQQRI